MDKIGYGKFFLQTLGEWQCDWFEYGIHLVPLGTRITVDSEAENTHGLNLPLTGDDTTLIAKDDFHKLVQSVGVQAVDLTEQFSPIQQRKPLLILLRQHTGHECACRSGGETGGPSFYKSHHRILVVGIVGWRGSLIGSAMKPGKGSEDGKNYCLF